MGVGGGRRGHLYAPTRLELTKSSSREEGGEDCDGDDDNATMRTTTLRTNLYPVSLLISQLSTILPRPSLDSLSTRPPPSLCNASRLLTFS